MPERPDLEYVVPALDRALAGRTVTAVTVRKPVVLRLAVRGGPDALVGHTVTKVTRRAHFVVFTLGGPIDLVVSPMLAGRFVITAATAKVSADLCLALTLDDGRVLRYRDDVQMGKVYVIPRDRTDVIAGYDPVGVDVLDPSRFTREAFRALAKKRRDQVKVFLMDKTALDAMGNAFADEVCWAARLHPKRRVATLSASEVDALHDAIVDVLGSACRTIAERAPPLDEKVRDFLQVRGRAGEACSRCGTTIRSAGVHGHDAEFCPTCQPDEAGTSIVDWRRLSAATSRSAEAPAPAPPRSAPRRRRSSQDPA